MRNFLMSKIKGENMGKKRMLQYNVTYCTNIKWELYSIMGYHVIFLGRTIPFMG